LGDFRNCIKYIDLCLELEDVQTFG
jgi:hypothetical protein